MNIETNGQSPTYSSWVPVFTGFSADPSNVVARYCVIGKVCFFYFHATAGTSNATTFTMTLPVAAANTQIQSIPCRGTDNGALTATAYIRTTVNSAIANCYPTGAFSTWTNSGNKLILCVGTYETI